MAVSFLGLRMAKKIFSLIFACTARSTGGANSWLADINALVAAAPDRSRSTRKQPALSRIGVRLGVGESFATLPNPYGE
jgi:hypothetical protein